MTCREVRALLLDRQASGRLHSEVTRHLELCRDCRALSHSEQLIADSFHDLRVVTPDITSSLDAAVMSAYREQFAEKPVELTPRKWFRLRFVFGAAAVLLIATVLILTSRRHATPVEVQLQQRPLPAIVEQPQQRSASVAYPVSSRRKLKRPRRTSIVNLASHQRPAPSRAPAADPSTSGFQSLMYCDPISCAGPMQVIRIQVPAFAVSRVPAPRPSNGLVQADVVVGSDGVARAIRVVR